MRALSTLVALCAAGANAQPFWAWLTGNYDRDDGVWWVDFHVNLRAGRVRTFTVEVGRPRAAPAFFFLAGGNGCRPAAGPPRVGTDRRGALRGAGASPSTARDARPRRATAAAAPQVDADYFAGNRFFRVIPGFMTQWGINGNPAVAADWRARPIVDDPVTVSNEPYTLSFATSGKDLRSAQVFINTVDNDRLDGLGFAPFAKIVAGHDDVDGIFHEHGESPQQSKIYELGNTFLKKKFPKLSFITKTEKKGKGLGYPAGYVAPPPPPDVVAHNEATAKAIAAAEALEAAAKAKVKVKGEL